MAQGWMVDFEWFVVLLIQYFVNDEAFSDPIRYVPVPKPEAETINPQSPSSSPSKKLCNFELISFHCKKCDKQKKEDMVPTLKRGKEKGPPF